jgi:hypothetical protein
VALELALGEQVRDSDEPVGSGHAGMYHWAMRSRRLVLQTHFAEF